MQMMEGSDARETGRKLLQEQYDVNVQCHTIKTKEKKTLCNDLISSKLLREILLF